ncbi:MAG: hypothetical protein KJZ65_06665 [Phycisphaerales bacterium]|nr:hypothetical protein [Phycisphaerales bacterium]
MLSGKEYWKKLGIQVPQDVAQEWNRQLEKLPRGMARVYATAALVAFLESPEPHRESLIKSLAVETLMEREVMGPRKKK